jgi:multisubunit Na+/H+ antiporter MnhF subunit
MIVWGGATALVVAAVASYGQHSFAPIAAVWAVLGPIAGGIVSHYFYRGPKG